MYHYLEPLDDIDVEIYHFDPSAKDSLFDKLYQKIHRFSTEDCVTCIGLRKKQANLIISEIQNGAAHSMLDLQKIEGLGEKSFELIYTFINESPRRIVTKNEQQYRLF